MNDFPVVDRVVALDIPRFLAACDAYAAGCEWDVAYLRATGKRARVPIDPLVDKRRQRYIDERDNGMSIAEARALVGFDEKEAEAVDLWRLSR